MGAPYDHDHPVPGAAALAEEEAEAHFNAMDAVDRVVDGFLVAIFVPLACHAAWPIVVGAWRFLQGVL